MSEEPPKIRFKNPQYSYIEPGGKKHVFKSLKQILAVEKTQQWPEGTMSCECTCFKMLSLKFVYLCI